MNKPERLRASAENPMGAPERWNALLDLLAAQGRVAVPEAAQSLGVSPATVRRDLNQLAGQQMLRRTRGGAVAHNLAYELPLRYKNARHAMEKLHIGKVAASLVGPGATVALNGGTTTMEVVRALAARADLQSSTGGPALTVVTNALNIANELVVRPQVKLVVTGGVARPQSYELIGPLAEPLLEGLGLDFAILGVDAVDCDEGASAHHEGEAGISRLMARRAVTVVIVADASKLARRAFARVCPTEEIDVLVTDATADSEPVASFLERGVRVLSAWTKTGAPTGP
jgi:DeoR/GlpR family transcriptional regulator of sugar metabolism